MSLGHPVGNVGLRGIALLLPPIGLVGKRVNSYGSYVPTYRRLITIEIAGSLQLFPHGVMRIAVDQ